MKRLNHFIIVRKTKLKYLCYTWKQKRHENFNKSDWLTPQNSVQARISLKGLKKETCKHTSQKLQRNSMSFSLCQHLDNAINTVL